MCIQTLPFLEHTQRRRHEAQIATKGLEALCENIQGNFPSSHIWLLVSKERQPLSILPDTHTIQTEMLYHFGRPLTTGHVKHCDGR